MRVLLAIDGSPSSTAARELVGSLDWPDGTVIEVAAAVEPGVDFVGTTVTPMPPSGGDVDTEVPEALSAALDSAVAALAAPNRLLSRALLKGRPATVIVDEAASFRAELVVLGSRGLGPLSSMLLGSVSAEVVDHAPCPVLVVRRPTLGSVLLAVDGSPSAQAAIEYLGGHHVLADHPIEVLSVAATKRALPPVHAMGPAGLAVDAPPVVASPKRQWAEDIAAAAVVALRGDGAHARWSISEGDPAHEIIEAARSFGSDLIVMGSRGLAGLNRFLVGSVARNVLLHTPTSVLIVHEPIRVRMTEKVAEPAVAPAG